METQQIIFSEVQRQNQKWIYYLILIILLIAILGFIQQVIFNKPFGTHPVADWLLMVFMLIPFLLILFMRSNILRTTITKDQVSYQFRPYHSVERVIDISDIDKCYVRLYNPVKEYGGWGVRASVKKGGGKALNMAGKYGIQLELKDGRKLLIGTQDPGKASSALNILFNQQQNGTD